MNEQVIIKLLTTLSAKLSKVRISNLTLVKECVFKTLWLKNKKEVQKIVVEAEELDGEVARKLRDIEKKEERKIDCQLKLHDIEISHRFKKQMTAKDYEDSKSEYEKLYNSAEEDLESLTSDLTENL